MTDIADVALKWVHLQKDQHDKCGRMTLRQIAVLGLVADNSPLDFGVLSNKLGLTKPVTTRAVSTLGRQGLVSQDPNPNDRRFRIVSITALGLEFRESLRLSADAL